MNEYAICFDFPGGDEPWFAALLLDGLGFTGSLAAALRFPSEDVAERMLANGYGDATRQCGAVVEVAA